MMLVDETTTTLVAATPPTVTLVAPIKLVPVIVIAVPPAVDPNNGDKEVIVGTGVVYVNAFVAVAVPSGVVTATLCAPTVPAGVTAVMLVDETTATLVAATPPTVTLVAPVKLVPVIVIAVPPAVDPDVGVIDVIVGCGSGAEVLATRKPMALLLPSVGRLSRRDARQLSELTPQAQPPPRNKRYEPVVGPVGFVTLADE